MIEPIKLPVQAGSDNEARLKRFLRGRIRSIRDGLKPWHDLLPNWRKAYEAAPAQPTRNFPFENASNLVVPIIAIHVDTLLARVMAAIIKRKPLWITRVIGMAASAPSQEVRHVLEEFLMQTGLDPSELDLYRVYHEWFGETIKIGTSIVKCPQVEDIEDIVVPSGDGTGKFTYETRVNYKGPRPEKLVFEDFGIPVSSKTVESADFKYHRKRLQKHELMDRAFKKIYDPEKVRSILSRPDRTTPSTVEQSKLDDAHLQAISADNWQWAEWDIYECYFRYRIDGTHFVRCLVWYHESSDTILRSFFDYYPENIFVSARLFYRDDLFPGYGFCETLGMLQEEVSVIHNQRRDNRTVSNTVAWRVSEDSKLHEGYKIFPSAMLPGEKDEIEPLPMGQPSTTDVEEERLSLELAEKRSGVQAPTQGAGAGVVPKRGPYSAMGTLSILQEGNTRQDLNVTDIQYAHTKLGRLLGIHYSNFGIDEDKLTSWGEKSELLQQALEGIKARKLLVPIYATTASINREVEKQNDLILSGSMMKYYGAISQMLQGATNQMIPKEMSTYLWDAMKAANLLQRTVMRHFGYDEAEQFVPDVPTPQPKAPPAPGGQGQPGGQSGQEQGGAPGGQPGNGQGQEPAQAGMLPNINPLALMTGAGGGKPQ